MHFIGSAKQIFWLDETREDLLTFINKADNSGILMIVAVCCVWHLLWGWAVLETVVHTTAIQVIKGNVYKARNAIQVNNTIAVAKLMASNAVQKHQQYITKIIINNKT